MDKKVIEMLHLDMEPVGIFFGNTSAECDINSSPEKRNCVVPLLVSSAKGNVISMNEESCNCPGGAVGCGFGDGKALNTIAPFGAACHSIVYAAEQMEKEEMMAVMGLFDISQRRADLSDYLSMTMPYALWEGLTKDIDKSCLTTHAWKEIEKRL